MSHAAPVLVEIPIKCKCANDRCAIMGWMVDSHANVKVQNQYTTSESLFIATVAFGEKHVWRQLSQETDEQYKQHTTLPSCSTAASQRAHTQLRRFRFCVQHDGGWCPCSTCSKETWNNSTKQLAWCIRLASQRRETCQARYQLSQVACADNLSTSHCFTLDLSSLNKVPREFLESPLTSAIMFLWAYILWTSPYFQRMNVSHLLGSKNTSCSSCTTQCFATTNRVVIYHFSV